MGGDCLNVGCVPSKALIRTARAAHEARNAAEFGVATGEVSVDFGKVCCPPRLADQPNGLERAEPDATT